MLRHEYMLGTVLPVFERLWQQYDLEMLIVGHMDDISHRLLQDFSEQAPRAAERIIIVGPVSNEEMAHHMRQADVLVHPRQGDWCPNIVIEAMACGLPVVCASWGGTAELVGDGGIVVPTGQWTYDDDFISGMAAGTAKVLENLESAQQAARTHAESKFNIQKVVQKYLAALEMPEG
jgi:glycosyltransferase involved in cell wall biosynthesis